MTQQSLLAAKLTGHGRIDPNVAVLNPSRSRKTSVATADRADFIASGEQHLNRVFATIRSDLAPDFAPRRALDFGCGSGRVLVPLARSVNHVVGADISSSMLAEAARNCAQAGVSNVALLGPRAIGKDWKTFDFIHSYIALQHIPQRQGLRIVRDLLAYLEEGGIGAFHFVYAARRPSWSMGLHWLRKRAPQAHATMMNVLQRRLPSPPVEQMNTYNLNAIFALLQQNGCHRVAARFTDHDGWLGTLLLFQRRREPDTPTM